MANKTAHRYQPSSWAIGFTAFAALMMIMMGIFQALVGISAIAESDFYAVTDKYLFEFDVMTWGWIHLILGAVVVAAGVGIFSGAVWARAIGVFIAIVSGVANFLFLPYYPLWSILIIAVDVAVIWALTAHGRDITQV